MTISNTLEVTILQSDLVWENPTENRKQFEEKINAIPNPVDLIVLPEMFTTGFTMNAKSVAESINGETVLWMQKMALKKQAAIVGSIIISERPFGYTEGNIKYFNRLLFVHPSGKIEWYDKRHTFTLAGEHEVFSAGKKLLLVEYKGWKICPLICYDLRFPVWSRNIQNYDVLLYVANWPKQRIFAWDALLKARAIENMSYTIGVNRVGKDANKYEYSGNSAVIDCIGKTIKKIDNGQEWTANITLDKNHQEKWREKLRFLGDGDTFIIQ